MHVSKKLLEKQWGGRGRLESQVYVNDMKGLQALDFTFNME